MNEAQEPLLLEATERVPFTRYTLAEVKQACAENTLGKLKWRENADGKPHDGIGRIYVSMPNPQCDLVVQTNDDEGRGSFHAFPAADWHHIDHPAQEKFVGIRKQLNRALNNLVGTLTSAPEFTFTPYQAYTLDEQIRCATELANHKVRHFDLDLSAFRSFSEEVEPLATQLEQLGARHENSEGIVALAQQLRKTMQQMKDFEPALDVLRTHNLSLIAPLEQSAAYYKAGNIDLAQTSLKHISAVDNGMLEREQRIIYSLNQNLMDRLHKTDLRVDAAEASLGLEPDPEIEALRQTIAGAQASGVRPNPRQKLDAVLDAVANMKTNAINAQSGQKPTGKGGTWSDRNGKQPGIRPAAERVRDDSTGRDR